MRFLGDKAWSSQRIWICRVASRASHLVHSNFCWYEGSLSVDSVPCEPTFDSSARANHFAANLPRVHFFGEHFQLEMRLEVMKESSEGNGEGLLVDLKDSRGQHRRPDPRKKNNHRTNRLLHSGGSAVHMDDYLFAGLRARLHPLKVCRVRHHA